MHRVPKIFVRSPNRRGDEADSGSGVGSSPSRQAAKRKPRLDRRNAKKNINYEFSPPAVSSPASPSYCSDESLRRQSLDYYGGKTSFRIDGMEGEVDILCRSLGFSGIEDFEIPTEEYEAMKVRSSSAPVAFSQAFELIDRKMEVAGERVVELSASCEDINVVHGIGARNDASVGLPVISNDIAGKKKEENLDSFDLDRNRTDVLGAELGARGVNSKHNVSGRSNELRGNGIKGVRPPVLTPPPPPSTSFPVVEKECLSWDKFGSYNPVNDTDVAKFKVGFCLGAREDGSEDGGHRGHDYEDQEEDRNRRIAEREETSVHSRCCSFTSTSNDDDSSSSTTEPTFSLSPNGRYRRAILEWQKGELLGRGSFGSVYEGIADDGFFFAVKEVSLLDHGEEGKQRILQLEQEIALLSQFEHENIVQYYGTNKDESRLYIFLELVSKGSLLSLYQKYTLRDSQVCAYTRQILHGLKYLHDRNVVHRDIKCANILVHTDGSVKLADFGLAKATKLNDVKSCKGTAFWMAPEVVRSRGYGLAADIWSLGCTVLEMLTGRFPYSNLECMAALFRIGKGERPPVPNTLSSDARDFILQCLQVDPKLRPTSAQLLDHHFLKRPPPSPLHFQRHV